MEKNKSFQGFYGKIVRKAVLIAFLLLGIVLMTVFMGAQIGNKLGGDAEKTAEALSSCEYYYYDGEYAGLLNTLELYETEGEEFDKYWEMARAYEAYQKWEVYAKGAELPDIDENEKVQYEDKAGGYEKTVRRYYDTSTDSENRSVMKSLIAQIENRRR